MTPKYSDFAFLLLACIWISPPCSAQQDSVFTVEQCVAMALENNRKAMSAQNNVEAAVNLKREAFTKYFPEISALGMAFWANHEILQYNLLDIIELGIIKKGKVAGVQALQPIFTGGLIINANKLAGVGEEVARLRKQQTDNELRLTTETLFWKLNTLESSMDVLNTAITFLDTLENQVNVAVEAGLVTRNDLLKVRLKRNGYMSPNQGGDALKIAIAAAKDADLLNDVLVVQIHLHLPGADAKGLESVGLHSGYSFFSRPSGWM